MLKERGADAVELGAAADVTREAVVVAAVAAGLATPNMTEAGAVVAAAVEAAEAPKATLPVEGLAAAAGFPPSENAKIKQ